MHVGKLDMSDDEASRELCMTTAASLSEWLVSCCISDGFSKIKICYWRHRLLSHSTGLAQLLLNSSVAHSRPERHLQHS